MTDHSSHNLEKDNFKQYHHLMTDKQLTLWKWPEIPIAPVEVGQPPHQLLDGHCRACLRKISHQQTGEQFLESKLQFTSDVQVDQIPQTSQSFTHDKHRHAVSPSYEQNSDMISNCTKCWESCSECGRDDWLLLSSIQMYRHVGNNCNWKQQN